MNGNEATLCQCLSSSITLFGLEQDEQGCVTVDYATCDTCNQFVDLSPRTDSDGCLLVKWIPDADYKTLKQEYTQS
jgi:hypothetical protein